MKNHKRPLRLLLAALGLAVVAGAAVAAAPPAPLGEDEVTPPRIKALFDAAFMKAGFDEDGDLKIEDEGLKTYVRVDAEKKLITLFALWGLKASVPEAKKLQLVNRLNDELIFVRFALAKSTTLWCDYQFLYEGGIAPFTIINNYRTFARVVKEAVASRDPDDIIGSD